MWEDEGDHWILLDNLRAAIHRRYYSPEEVIYALATCIGKVVEQVGRSPELAADIHAPSPARSISGLKWKTEYFSVMAVRVVLSVIGLIGLLMAVGALWMSLPSDELPPRHAHRCAPEGQAYCGE
jgi:hypothetical protein